MYIVPFLRAEWQNLAMINYLIEPKALQSLVPNGTELDDWNGSTYISVVGFNFKNTTVRGLKFPFHVNFEEVNLRFYVRRKTGAEWRRGVVFIKEIVPRYAIAAVARLLYQEKYVSLRMRHSVKLPDKNDAGLVKYEWKLDDRWNHLSITVSGNAEPAQDGSEEQFITEHYWGYSSQKDGGCVEYKVEHPKWNVWRAIESSLECDISRLYGLQFEESLSGKPTSAFLADGSPVIVYKGVKHPYEA